ncbi:MAG: hypothetical protein IT236_04080 [Bacteroidia bacterium]|nr:hypothetical protein [Bacteroidia bacterium]
MLLVMFYLNYRTKILNKEKESQLAAFKLAVMTEEKMKSTIAYDLHDGVIPTLSALSRNLEQHILNYRDGNFNIHALSNDYQVLIENIAEIRQITHNLVPKMVFNFGCIKAVESFTIGLNSTKYSTGFENKTNFKKIPFSKNEEVNIYRICLEILNNLTNHANYSYLKVIFSNTAQNMIIEIIHDGKGVTNEEINALTETSPGLGLKSLLSRALLLNAKIDYFVNEDVATVTIRIPYSNDIYQNNNVNSL